MNSIKRRYALALMIVTCSAFAAEMPRTFVPGDARAYSISPLDGATVTSPVTVRLGLSGMGIAPAGMQMANTGHHHLHFTITVQ